MATSTFNTRVRDLLKKEANRAANLASTRIYNIARQVIGSAVDHSMDTYVRKLPGLSSVTLKSFYGDYPRKKGQRLSYNRTGNLENSFASTLHPYGEDGVMAKLEFSAQYMKEDYHLGKVGKRTPYNKEAVLKYDYEDGWHGQPVFYGHKMPQMKPSPAERISGEIDALSIKEFVTDASANRIINSICDLMNAELDKYCKDG